MRKLTTSLALEKKKSYMIRKLEGCSSKSFFSVVNSLLDNEPEYNLPGGKDDAEIAEEFKEFFESKVLLLRNSFSSKNTFNSSHCDTIPIKSSSTLSYFRPTTIDELKQIIAKHPTKCSPTDPVPSKLLTLHSDTFLPIWMELVNLSLEQGDMSGLKDSVLLPILKGASVNIDIDCHKNYRPITNLLFLDKLIERVVAIRLDEHMITNNLHIDNQYGYKKFHSTELLLTKIFNDLLLACDKGTPSILILLDLSAAFDTIDIDRLLDILKTDIGICGVALNWFSSFLRGRKCTVKIAGTYSSEWEQLYGVPQGSILGPILFSIYIRRLYYLFPPSNFTIGGFADDNQLAKQFLVSMQVQILGECISECLTAIESWMNAQFLSINTKKTKIIVVAPPDVVSEITIHGVILNSACIRFVTSAKNLGVVVDNILSLNLQVNRVAKACFNVIKKLSSIRAFLSKDQLHCLVCAHILNRLDYCNALYYGLPSTTIKALQRVQNSALRLVEKGSISFRSPLSPFYLSYHWLHVRERIQFKVLLIVHNCLHDKAPNELRHMLKFSDSVRTMSLQEPRVHTNYGKRAFSHAGPKLWNLLPSEIRAESDTETFKKRLKSFLLIKGDMFNAMINRR